MFVALAALLLQVSPVLSLSDPVAIAKTPPVALAASGREMAPTAPALEIDVILPLADANSSGLEVYFSTPEGTPSVLAEEPKPFVSTAQISPRRLHSTPAAGLISVVELQEEVRHQKKIWFFLAAVEHGAAVFDAWSTRRAIANGGHEINPLMKPFANSGAIYAATQAGPLLFDYVGKRMMMSRSPRLRRLWWLPQTASAAASLFSGIHNLGVHGPAQP